MEQKVERIRELLDASIQIIDHMEESGATAAQVQQIKQSLQHQAAQLSNGTTGASSGIQNSFNQVVRMVDQLEGQTRASYNKATGDAVEQFEMKSLDDQLSASHAYHEKIDYKSMVKVRENLEQVLILSRML